MIELPRSKTDQEGAGRKVGIPSGRKRETCPVRALREWLCQAHITEGAVFRAVDRHGNVSMSRLHPDSIGKLVKRAVARACIPADGISGHCFRVGHVTQAAENGVSDYDIMKQTGHRSQRMVWK